MTSKREKKQQLDKINVSLRLLKLQRALLRDEALTRNDKEAAMILMKSMDNNQEEKRKLEDELKACDTSEENAKDDNDDDNNNNAETTQNSTLNQPEQVNVQTEEELMYWTIRFVMLLSSPYHGQLYQVISDTSSFL